MNGFATLDDSFKEQINLENKINKFYDSTKPKSQNKKEKKCLLTKWWMKFLKEDCSSQNRLPIALTQVKADNTSESLFNESLQIVFLLSWGIELTKKYIIIQMN